MRLYKWIYTAVLLTAVCAAVAQTPLQQDDGAKRDTVETLLGLLAEKPGHTQALVELCSQYTMRGDFDKSLEYARKLRGVGLGNDDARALMYSDFYTGQTYLLTNQNDSITYYLNRALDSATDLDDKRALTSVYNALGIYSTGVEMNYRTGIEHFMKALEYGKDDPKGRLYMIVLSNLAMTYYMRNDPAGLQYAREVYDTGQERGDEYLAFGGAVMSAYMHYMLGENEQAMRFIEEALPLTDKYKYQSEVYSLYANILHAMGQDRQAEAYYAKALDYIGTSVVTAAAMTYLNYASYLLDIGKTQQATSILESGIEVSKKNNNAVNRHLLYLRMAEALSKLGRHREALDYFRVYHNESDSIFNVERERSINELRVKYETERQESELRRNRIVLLQEQRKLQATLTLLIVLIVTVGAIYVLYRRKNKMYRQIVKQHHDFLRKEKKMADTAARKSGQTPPQAGAARTDRDDHDLELFRRLEALMDEERAYRENGLTIEKLAERLGTNRTYLSRTINQQAGISFVGYINGYRIDEAVRILSDINNDMPLKVLADFLGYNHIQTFYTSFQNAIGVPPSKFREKLMELYKENNL